MEDNKERKDYYQKLFVSLLDEVDKSDDKPTLFLHACCGPCLTYPLSVLVKHFKVTVGFFNPNIQPLSEYEKRLATVEEFIRKYAIDHNLDISFVINDEDFLAYEEAFKDRINDHEGGKTCLKCHAYRMGLAYEYANAHGFDYFTTVMTVSCKKPSRELNEIAEELAKKYKNTKYLYSDFKKENGQKIGIDIAKEYHLYRQDYCGCLPSLRERERIKELQSLKSRTNLS